MQNAYDSIVLNPGYKKKILPHSEKTSIDYYMCKYKMNFISQTIFVFK